jgi:hypothetical protein
MSNDFTHDPVANGADARRPDARSLAVWKYWANEYASPRRHAISALHEKCRCDILSQNEHLAAVGQPLLIAPSCYRFMRLIKALNKDLVLRARSGGASAAPDGTGIE